MVGFGIVIPILPFITPRLGGSNFDIAMIIATYAVASSLVGPFWGRLSDRIGRKPVLMICTSGAAIAYVLLANASELWMIYVARTLAGLMAGNFPVASAMMADITPPAERARGMGKIGAAFGLGLVLGPVLGGLLAGPDGSFVVPCMLAAATSCIAVVAAWLFLPESLPPGDRIEKSRVQSSLWAVLRESQSRLLMFQYVLHTGAASVIIYLFPLWVYALINWQAREVGIVFGVMGAIMALNQGLLMSHLVRWMGELRLLRVSISMFLLGLLVAVWASEPVPMVAALIFAMTGGSLCMPVLNAMASRSGGTADRGRILGATSTAAGIGRVGGPLLGGALLSAFGFQLAWASAAVLVALYWYWAFFTLNNSSAIVHDAH